MDPILLTTALAAGASISGSELVKEATKDAYKGLKTAVTSVFGKRAERALEAVEAAPADEKARSDLKETLPAVDPRDVAELQQKTTLLLTALKDDPAAIQAVDTVARIRLDIDAGGNVVLEDNRLDQIVIDAA